MFYLFLFYILLTPLEYIQEKIPKGPTGINYQNLMLLAMLVWWVLGRSTKGRKTFVQTPINLPIVLFLGWTFAGLILTSMNFPGAESPFAFTGRPFTFFLRLFNGMAFFFLAVNLLDTRQKVRYCLYTMMLSMALVFRAFYSDVGMRSLSSYNHGLRFRGPFVYIGSNELAAMFVFGGLFFLIYAFTRHRWWEKCGFLTVATMYAYGVLYSFSRGAQLAYVVALGLIAVLRYRFVLVLILLAVGTMDMWVPNSVRQRWEMTETEEGELESSAASRKVFWALAQDLFQQSPVWGHGVLSFKVINPEAMDTHNVYLRILAEQGLVGIGLFIFLWISILRTNLKLWRAGPEPEDRQFGFALFIATIGLMIANVFGDRFSHMAMIGQYWLLVGIGTRLYTNMIGLERFEDEPAREGEGETPQPAPTAAQARHRRWVTGGALASQALRMWPRARLWLVKPLQHAHTQRQKTRPAFESAARPTHQRPALKVVKRGADQTRPRGKI